MLHRVLPSALQSYLPEMAVSRDLFQDFLAWLTANYKVTSLENCIEPGDNSAQACALTFDDGWRDVYLYAFPSMVKFGVTATVFVPTEFVGTTRRFWQERLHFCLTQARTSGDGSVRAKLEVLAGRHALSEKQPHYGAMRRALLKVPSHAAEAFVSDLETAIGTEANCSGPAFMNWDEVRTMSKAGFAFGSHTLNHVLLTRTDVESAVKEIVQSRDELEARLGTTADSFSYPWGANNSSIEHHVRLAGYRYAVTTVDRLAPARVNPIAIPRVFVSDSIMSHDGKFSAAKLEWHLARLGLKSLF